MHKFFNVSYVFNVKILRGTLYEWRRSYMLTSPDPFTLSWLPLGFACWDGRNMMWEIIHLTNVPCKENYHSTLRGAGGVWATVLCQLKTMSIIPWELHCSISKPYISLKEASFLTSLEWQGVDTCILQGLPATNLAQLPISMYFTLRKRYQDEALRATFCIEGASNLWGGVIQTPPPKIFFPAKTRNSMKIPWWICMKKRKKLLW